MDKQAYHYNKKKLKGKTAGTYLYFYPCDPSDNPDKWIDGKAYAVIEVTEPNGKFYLLLTEKSTTTTTHTFASLLR